MLAARKPSAGQAAAAPVQFSAESQTPADARQTVLAARKPSVGQATAEPSHVSATSQTPAEARHTVPLPATPSLGQAALEPEHVSATSHTPADARQTVVAGWKLSPGQAFSAPSQVSAVSQTPADARQTVPAPTLASAGHPAELPVHDSVASQTPCEARHTVVAAMNTSSGHALVAPSQVSAVSQTPAEARHTVPELALVSAGHEAPLPVQVSAVSQAPAAARQTVAALWKVSAGQPLTDPSQASATSHGPAAARQTVPTALAGLLQVPEFGSQVPASWQLSWALQVTGDAPVQLPAMQVSTWVQALPSVQVVPSTLLGWLQVPLAGSQMPTSWHWSNAVQVTGLAPAHSPDWQVSTCVHALPSLHPVPSTLFGWLQAPLLGSQVPASWHWSSAVQTTGLAPVHVPDWQVSAWVHASPSLHVVPSTLFGLLHAPVPVSQVPASWHWSSALQTTGFAPVHVPDWQVSAWVHALASLQVAPSVLAGWLQAPLLGSQMPALWHWSRAVHTTGLAPAQAPAWHVSLCVQALPSSHSAPLVTGV